MKIETVLSAKSIWLFETRALNPRGRNIYPLLGPWLKRYGFKEPTEFDEAKGVKFLGGEFSPSQKGDDMTGIAVTVFNDGVVAESWTNTNDTDLFLTRVLQQLAKDGIIAFNPDWIKHKRYATEFVVRPEAPLKPLPNFSNLYKTLAEIVYPNTSARFETAGLVFDVDFSFPGRQVSFTFQRRVKAPFEENLYYSHGPFSNAQHERILDELERLITA